MSLPIQDKQAFGSICRELLDMFSASFPNKEFHCAALRSLDNLLSRRDHYDGDPGGWAGGLVYMIARHDWNVSHPTFLNRQLEAIFGVSMGTIRKRAVYLWPAIFPDVFVD